jgi:ankyrin
VETLLEAGADPNAPGEYGELPLHVAVNTKNEEIVKKLLEAGASCSGIDKNGTDAWSVASSVNFTSQLKRLADSIGR